MLRNGILFNHESPRRGRNFVTKKISQAVSRIVRGQQDVLKLGNLSAQRDWGYAPEFVEAMWLMMQQPEPGDYVVGTGSSYSVRQFVEFCFSEVGIAIEWIGQGADEIGRDRRSGKVLVTVDPVYFRPTEVDQLRSDPSAAQRKLGWKARILAPELARLMVRYDLVHDDYGFSDVVSDDDVARRLPLPR
jgi:GDPmannose 4,6-dehydratase